ncbi:ABC transporter permease [Cohnella luojiensis]|uniref:Transport permease protein n=1 Tax=Cohnella luojiensis TaxID=652876 RepID=A0A4Y8M3B4_9BACL|nr:ABC transporter permease [Cohnella luojiensis]
MQLIKALWYHKNLISQFIIRDVIARYRGSYLGILWSFINPLLMLVVYTFVFSEIFKAKWGTDNGSTMEYALMIFCGLITFNIFAELLGKAPSLIINHSSYVTKVVFPLEILPVSIMGSTLIHSGISLLILIFSNLIAFREIHWTLILIPIVLLPLIFLSIGIGWVLSSLGVYLRDIGQIVGIILQAMMLLSPIFYSVSTLPSTYQLLFAFNPVSYVIEDMRLIVLQGQLPHFYSLIIEYAIGILIFYAGYIWFNKSRKGFSDVL